MDKEKLSNLRHTLAHVLAQAVLEKYPNAQLTLGPAVDNGFYYDIDFGADKITEDDLKTFQTSMRKNLKKWTEFTHQEVSKEEALQQFVGNPYKEELIDEISERGEKITLYTAGGFTDLCRGGHLENPAAEISTDAFKLDRIAGAYWRGDENNRMLTRVYGLAFESAAKLEEYINLQEEAKKRDHRKIGKEMKLFTVSELIGAGLPLMQPNGMIVRKQIEDYLWELHASRGYSRVWTPHIAKESLYEMSGHAGHYMDDMFKVRGGSSKEEFYLKPMNCPHHMQIFADNQFSYRDMPVRYFEPATVYRDEKSGQLGGLTRVRAITQDDGHLFCMASEIGNEIKTIVDIIKQFYTTMGMMDGYWVRLSLRGDDTSKYLGSDEVWNTAEKALTDVCIAENLPYKPAKDEAAFYGPKLDFMFKDAIGREWQLATIQCDFNLPERFDLSFTNEQGIKERPVVIHRAISGSLERFMGVLIEHFAGNFPAWLAPTQVAIVPVRENHEDAAYAISEQLKTAGVRVSYMDASENMGKRVRKAKDMKASYTVILGDKDLEAGMITVETRGKEQGEQMTIEAFAEKILKEIKDRSL